MRKGHFCAAGAVGVRSGLGGDKARFRGSGGRPRTALLVDIIMNNARSGFGFNDIYAVVPCMQRVGGLKPLGADADRAGGKFTSIFLRRGQGIRKKEPGDCYPPPGVETGFTFKESIKSSLPPDQETSGEAQTGQPKERLFVETVCPQASQRPCMGRFST